MVSKIPILPHRVRQVPPQFSWVDHRLVRERYIDCCSHSAAALYLFLVTVGDAIGMSYYGESAIMQRLSMDDQTLKQARDNLVAADLIAWKRPLYQVLSFKEQAAAARGSMVQPLSLGEILRKASQGGAT